MIWLSYYTFFNASLNQERNTRSKLVGDRDSDESIMTLRFRFTRIFRESSSISEELAYENWLCSMLSLLCACVFASESRKERKSLTFWITIHYCTANMCSLRNRLRRTWQKRKYSLQRRERWSSGEIKQLPLWTPSTTHHPD
jgi:hypothetical protein